MLIYLNCFIGLVFGLIFFICAIKAYTVGLQHGKQLSNAIVPKLNLNPVKAVQEVKTAIEEKKQADELAEGWQNIFNYNPMDHVKEK